MTGKTCGTGGWATTNPNEPDSNSVLTATPAFGGIDVEWTYPSTNAENVAYAILYRGTSDNFSFAIRHKIVNGNFFYDKTTSATPIKYYYWVQFVSVFGTWGTVIGPASATARPTIEDMIELLTGQIDSGVLAQSLKGEIDKITLNKLAITQEMLDRDKADDALGVYLNEVAAHSGEVRALLQQEVLARTSADEAFVSKVDTLYSELDGSIAALQDEQTAMATAQQALAQRLVTAQSELGGQIASVQTTMQTKIDATNGTVREIGALYTAKVSVNGLVGGFGIYNNGATVEAGFDVDRFWIGRTSSNKRKPFIIEGNEVFIDQAAINKLTFTKLRDESGSFVVQNGKVKADYITIGDASIGTAHIKDAAITTGKIANLSVDTFKIAGNAVTVPMSSSGGAVAGNGGYQVASELVFTMPDGGGYVYASATGMVGYAIEQGQAVGSFLEINGQRVAGGDSRYYYITVAHSGSVYVPGNTRVSVRLWFMGPQGVTLGSSSLYALAVRR